MKPIVTPVAERFFYVLVESGVIPDELFSSSDCISSVFGECFACCSTDIVRVRCVSRRCYTRDGDFRVFSLAISFHVDSDDFIHYSHPFRAVIISGYCFRKLRKLLKVNGFM